MEDLSVSIIQTDLQWENPVGNLKQFELLFQKIDNSDLILLPEMFTTGFSMNAAHLAEEMDGSSINWMRIQAKKKGAVICGSLIIKEEGSYYNRLIWMTPNGSYKKYDKRHLFRMANENETFTGGESRLICQLKGWKIMPLVCYDLRFPVWSRNQFNTDRATVVNAEYDLLLYIANWPEARIGAWNKLLAARAIENQAYVVGVNRIGEDGNKVAYNGSSQFIDTKGDVIWQDQDSQTVVKTVDLKANDLIDFRNKFPVGMDGDSWSFSV